MQIVIAADDCSVAAAAPRVVAFLRHERDKVIRVFLVVLALVVGATGASFVAAGLLSLIAFVPFVGLAVLPLQLMAWLLRALVFQYIGLSVGWRVSHAVSNVRWPVRRGPAQAGPCVRTSRGGRLSRPV